MKLSLKTATLALVAVVAAAGALWSSGHGTAQAAPTEVRLRLPSFALNLHPLRMVDVDSRSVATLLHAGLVFEDQDGGVRPLLARQWTRTGKVWEFVLRRGLAFSNGEPVEAKDVVASLCAAMQPESPLAWALSSIEHVRDTAGKTLCTGLAAVATDRVRIEEEQPVPWLLDALSGPAGWVMPASGPKPEAFGVVPGAGPYRVREIVPDVRVVLEARRDATAVTPGVDRIRFDYLPDDLVAANRFASGTLHVLDVTTPQLVDAVVEGTTGKLRHPGSLLRSDWDRIRVAIVNEKALLAKGFSTELTRAFIDAFSASVDREKIARLSNGVGVALGVPFLPVPPGLTPTGAKGTGLAFPGARLTIITEPDAFSDLIAASMPRKLGDVRIGYKGVDKGLLLNSLIKGDYDIAVVPIEATQRSPAFWKSFFTPGSPFSVFGKPIPGLEKADVSSLAGLSRVASEILNRGNWVAIIRERRIQAIAAGVSGIAYSASGQTNYAFIGRD